LNAVVAGQPARFTAVDRLQEVPTEKSKAMIVQFDTNPGVLESFLSKFGGVAASLDRTDGLRITLTDGRIVHLRPSGNAPECRLYAEADSAAAAQKTLTSGLAALRTHLG
jgi:phosphomannomutase